VEQQLQGQRVRCADSLQWHLIAIFSTVDFAKFAKALYTTLKLPPPGPKDLQFRLLSALCALSNKRDDRQVATLERFSLFTKWFGPLKGAKKNILDTMQAVCENP